MPVHKTAHARPLFLIVDDELPVLKVVERLAEKAGFEAMTFAGAADALRALGKTTGDPATSRRDAPIAPREAGGTRGKPS
jgi:ActR/RegA family two-component response regulator